MRKRFFTLSLAKLRWNSEEFRAVLWRIIKYNLPALAHFKVTLPQVQFLARQQYVLPRIKINIRDFKLPPRCS
jgi:hypothetical protein